MVCGSLSLRALHYAGTVVDVRVAGGWRYANAKAELQVSVLSYCKATYMLFVQHVSSVCLVCVYIVAWLGLEFRPSYLRGQLARPLT